MNRSFFIAGTLLSIFLLPLSLAAQGTAFTYQGQLQNNGSPASGTYDFRFILYDNNVGGSQQGPILTNATTAVSNGLFTVTLDFSDQFPGAARWLDIAVRTNGNGSFTELSSRQQLTPTPYSIFAEGASATGLTGTVPAASLAGAYGGAINFTNAANNFSGNGQGLLNVNAVTLDGLPAANFWQLGGNNLGFGQILGSLNNQPVIIQANGLEVMQLAYASNSVSGFSPNIIGGNSVNTVSAGVVGATIGGGGRAGLFGANAVGADFGTVVGGEGCSASARFAIAGGGLSSATGQSSVALGSSFASGTNSAAFGNSSATNSYATAMGNSVAGGFGSTAMGYQTTAGFDGDTAMGGNTTANGGDSTAMGGNTTASGLGSTAMGDFSTASGEGSTAMGESDATNDFATAMGDSVAAGFGSTAMGFGTASGDYSFAAGNEAFADQPGTFIWCDSLNQQGHSQGANTFTVRASGGYFLYSSAGATGVYLAAGGGSWANISDRNVKENLVPVDPGEVLDKVASLPVSTWNYKTQDKSIRHVGPMAQDFAAAFHVGEDNRHITEVDEGGVALAAIQGLNQKVQNSDARVQQLEVENAELKQRLETLEQLILKQKPN